MSLVRRPAVSARRSEIVSLDAGDLAFTDDGLVVTLRRSKTDQEGQGRAIGIPYGPNPATCPVRALRSWLETARIEAGRCSGQSTGMANSCPGASP